MNEYRGKSIPDVVRKAVGRPAPEYRGGDVCKRLLAEFGAQKYEVGRIEERLKNLENAIKREQRYLEQLEGQMVSTAVMAGLSLGLTVLGTLGRVLMTLSRLRKMLQNADKGRLTDTDVRELAAVLLGLASIGLLLQQLKQYDAALNNKNNFYAQAVQLEGEVLKLQLKAAELLNEYKLQGCGTGGV